jgi:hypothetical protein
MTTGDEEMNNQEFELMANKAIKAAPDWLKDDLNNIVRKEGNDVRITKVISILYNQYSFNMSHIFASMNQHVEWTDITRERLTLIDNNLDLIDLMIKDIKKGTH